MLHAPLNTLIDDRIRKKYSFIKRPFANAKIAFFFPKCNDYWVAKQVLNVKNDENRKSRTIRESLLSFIINKSTINLANYLTKNIPNVSITGCPNKFWI